MNTEALTKLYGRLSLKLSKYSPEILLVLGVAGAVGAAVMASKATLKLEETVEKTQSAIDSVHRHKENAPEEAYSDLEYRKDLAVSYAKRGLEIGKLYAPAISIGVASLSCIIGSHGIMSRRNAGLIAAYNLLSESFKNYRKRVIEDFGEEKDFMYRHGIVTETVTETVVDEEGKKTKVKKIVPSKMSQYARDYDETLPTWRNDRESAIFFFNCQQAKANAYLRTRGHVFLNEVYDYLGMPRTKDGNIVGWIAENHPDEMRPEYTGVGPIDFGHMLDSNLTRDPFLKGYSDFIQLDFNVDGLILDLI